MVTRFLFVCGVLLGLGLAAPAAWAQSYPGEEGAPLDPGAAIAQLEEGGRGLIDLGLRDLDLSLASPNGDLVLELSGLIDVEWYGLGQEPSGMVTEDKHFVNVRFQAFADLFIGEWISGLVEFRADRGHDPGDKEMLARVNQGYLRVEVPQLADTAPAFAQVGVFATPFGNFMKRHDSWSNPLVRRPLPYDHRTSLQANFMDQFAFDDFPSTRAGFVSWRDRKESDWRGEPIIWQEVYAGGAMLFGTFGSQDGIGEIEYAAAIMNSNLGSTAYTWGEWPVRHEAWTFHGRIGWRPTFGQKVGFSYAWGAWLPPDAERWLGDREYTDFKQWTFGLDYEWTAGHLDVFAEVLYSQWHAPIGRPGVTTTGAYGANVGSAAGYLEAKYTLAALGSWASSWFVATRVGYVWNTHLAVERPAGPWWWSDSDWRWKWDRDQVRWEWGTGYFLGPELLIKAAWEWNHTITHNDPNDNAFLMQVVLRF
jgi:hypothetical protein